MYIFRFVLYLTYCFQRDLNELKATLEMAQKIAPPGLQTHEQHFSKLAEEIHKVGGICIFALAKHIFAFYLFVLRANTYFLKLINAKAFQETYFLTFL